MIDIYTERNNSKDWIIHNDMYFNLYTGKEDILLPAYEDALRNAKTIKHSKVF